MQGTIAITDVGWYEFLFARPTIKEVNFWTPSARRAFRATPFSPFLFKLRAPHNAVCGLAYFAQYSRLPDWLAWESFLEGNGCASLEEMRLRIAGIRERIRYEEATESDDIGCIQLVQPVLFPRRAWVPQPTDWRARTQSHAKYELGEGEGLRVWQACLNAAADLLGGSPSTAVSIVGEIAPRYGTAQLVAPRLGQSTFRVAVMDAYLRACAVTQEHSLPALEASHIQPYASEGPHEVANGLLLRADLHRLFDKGYLTVSRDLRLEVGSRLRNDFHNGRSYYPLHGTRLRVPAEVSLRPSSDYLSWHREHVFLG